MERPLSTEKMNEFWTNDHALREFERIFAIASLCISSLIIFFPFAKVKLKIFPTEAQYDTHSIRLLKSLNFFWRT